MERRRSQLNLTCCLVACHSTPGACKDERAHRGVLAAARGWQDCKLRAAVASRRRAMGRTWQLETSDEVVTTPALSLSEYYTFRVRASLFDSAATNTQSSAPSSPPAHPVKDPNASRKQPKPAKSNSKNPSNQRMILTLRKPSTRVSSRRPQNPSIPLPKRMSRRTSQSFGGSASKMQPTCKSWRHAVFRYLCQGQRGKVECFVKIKRDVLSRSEPSNGTDAFDGSRSQQDDQQHGLRGIEEVGSHRTLVGGMKCSFVCMLRC